MAPRREVQRLSEAAPPNTREVRMLWAALLPNAPPCSDSARTEALSGLANWCLQFTPRVALVEPARRRLRS